MRSDRQARVGFALMKVASLGPRLSLVALLLVTALVGNLRGHGSAGTVANGVKEPVTTESGRSPRVLPVGSEEEGQLIPAVYAWDPAVRFVYYRHVSKWM